MTVKLAFGPANNGTSGVRLHPRVSPMTVELASNKDISHCPLTLYKNPNDGGVSLPIGQKRSTSVSTYDLQKVQ